MHQSCCKVVNHVIYQTKVNEREKIPSEVIGWAVVDESPLAGVDELVDVSEDAEEVVEEEGKGVGVAEEEGEGVGVEVEADEEEPTKIISSK